MTTATKAPTGGANTLTLIPEWATFGTADDEALIAAAPTITAFEPEGLELPGATMIQVVYEAPMRSAGEHLPSALAPVHSSHFVTWRGLSLPETPWGPTTIAETRIVCRAGFRPRLFLLDARTDNENALDELRSRWGYRVEKADEVKVRRYHDVTKLTVVDGGETRLAVEAVQPMTTSGTAFGLNASVHAANTPIGPRLVQVGIDYTFSRAEICRPKLHAYDAAYWNAEGMTAEYPVSAITGVADLVFREIKFASRFDKPALFGTENVQKES